jgi:type I restriction-modification system DNA methylase subunit
VAAPREVLELVDRFHRHRSSYSQTTYKEAQVCAEFIEPLFEVLGWDMRNRAGYAEAYKDVIHQHTLKSGFGTEAPDYCFRIGGTPKFFLEAKKPSINVSTDVAPAFQLRRYAWTAKLPLSVLTDFEELAIYDTSVRPAATDKATTARIQYVSYEQYLDRWEEIASIFSRDAILKGSFDKFAQSTTGKRGTSSVDVAFLAEIEGWRDSLARNIALRNRDLCIRELNFAVQRTIDRILFLRICEDRGIDQYGRLQALMNGTNTYSRLYEIFEQADQRYNSGLFHFQKERERDIPDELTPKLTMDDKVLKDILGRLYYPESPYEFSIMPADVLGQVYEQFLGKVIRLTAGHQAKVEDKPEVKKAGGVYYTPTYIVDYIVKNTVGKLLESCSKPKDVEKLRILDPACGSGSFLIVAFQTLLDWHLGWYTKNDPESWAKKSHPPVFTAPKLDPDGGVLWRLTTSEKKRILLNGIYGVDIDSQAVEVTKLSLMLKVLEGESDQTINRQMSLFHERALPDLSSNIKCGNSLIGPDFYDGQQLGLLDQEQMYRVNVFDWKRAFPAIMEAGGFDTIVGNPPYIRIQALKEWAPLEVEHYKKAYKAASKGNYDIYVCFVEKGLSLLNPKGKLGFILPHKFFNSQYGQPLRELIAGGRHLSDIVHFGDQQIFSGATTYTCLLFLSYASLESFSVQKVSQLDQWQRCQDGNSFSIASALASSVEWAFQDSQTTSLLSRLCGMRPLLNEVCGRIFQGIKTGCDPVYILRVLEHRAGQTRVYSKATEAEHLLESDILHPLVKGGDCRRYALRPANLVMAFPYKVEARHQVIPEEALKIDHPLAWEYFARCRKRLSEREAGRLHLAEWYAFSRSQALDVIGLPKLITPDISPAPSFALDRGGEVFFTGGVAGGYGLLVRAEYSVPAVLALLNSTLLGWIHRQGATVMRGGYFSFESRFIGNLPMGALVSGQNAGSWKLESICKLSEQLISLSATREGSKTPEQRDSIIRQIEATDHQIDQLVYELYGLTDAEIAIVEGTSDAGMP